MTNKRLGILCKLMHERQKETKSEGKQLIEKSYIIYTIYGIWTGIRE